MKQYYFSQKWHQGHLLREGDKAQNKPQKLQLYQGGGRHILIIISDELPMFDISDSKNANSNLTIYLPAAPKSPLSIKPKQHLKMAKCNL
jgi:hypothetical protein